MRKSYANLHLLDLDLADRCAVRRQYRILRIAIYAPQSSEYAVNGMYQGCYGMDREQAKQALWAFYSEVSYAAYLGSK